MRRHVHTCHFVPYQFPIAFCFYFNHSCYLTDSSCEHFWESNQELHACYQFNLYTILTWSQALSTCQAQGGNLLSITSLAEYRYIRGRWNLVESTCTGWKDRSAEWRVLWLHSPTIQQNSLVLEADVFLARWDTEYSFKLLSPFQLLCLLPWSLSSVIFCPDCFFFKAHIDLWEQVGFPSTEIR